jgi:hypothetical protein
MHSRVNRRIRPFLELLEEKIVLAVFSESTLPGADADFMSVPPSITGTEHLEGQNEVDGSLDWAVANPTDPLAFDFDRYWLQFAKPCSFTIAMPNLGVDGLWVVRFLTDNAGTVTQVSGGILNGTIGNGYFDEPGQYVFLSGGTLTLNDPAGRFPNEPDIIEVEVLSTLHQQDKNIEQQHTPYSFHADVDVNVAPPTPANGSLTAYRPISPPIDYELHSMSKAEMASLGVGIRVNGDDDNHDGVADYQSSERSVAGEDDLVRLDTHLLSHGPDTLQYVITTDNPAIRLWSSETKVSDFPTLSTSSETSFVIPQDNSSVWVEWASPNGGVASLKLQTFDTVTFETQTLDSVSVHTFLTDMIYFGGEAQIPVLQGVSTDPPEAGDGSMQTALQLYQAGYDVHFFNIFGKGTVSNAAAELTSAYQTRGVKSAALIGYSHGAGAVYFLTKTIASSSPLAGLTIPLTVYIDGIKLDYGLKIFNAERRKPIRTLYHVNYYQNHKGGRFGVPTLGEPTFNTPARQNVLVNRILGGKLVGHSDIDDFPAVQAGIVSNVRTRVVQ